VTFFEELPKVLETLEQVVALIQNLGVGLLERIVKGFIDEFTQKQEASNPFSATENEELHLAFESQWYIGYVGGFVVKTLVGASATKILKGSTKFQKVVDKLSSTRVGSVVTRIKAPVDAAKARVASKLTDGLTKAGSKVVSVASTATSSLRVSRLTDKVKLGAFDRLSESRAKALSRLLLRDGDEGAEAFADGGRDLLDVIADFDGVSPEVVRRLDDLESEGSLSLSDIKYLERSLEQDKIDDVDLRRLTSLYQGRDGALIGDRVEIEDVVRSLRDTGGSNRLLGVVRPADARGIDRDTIHLDTGNKRTGEVHIRSRHVSGSYKIDQKRITSLFPAGQTVKGRKLPDKMSPQDIRQLALKGVKNGDNLGRQGEDIVFAYEPEIDGISRVEIGVDRTTGRITKMIPEGPAVKQWVGEAGEWKDRL
jgi:hypothetical protein